MLTYLPMLLSILKRTRTLATAAQSKTTKGQYEAVLLCAGIVATLAYFVPALQDSDTALGVVVAIAALASPLVSRLIAYRDKKPTACTKYLTDVDVVNVRGEDKVWHQFGGTLADAANKGYHFAADRFGDIWDTHEGHITGEVLRTRTGTDAESQSRVKTIVETLRREKEKKDGNQN